MQVQRSWGGSGACQSDAGCADQNEEQCQERATGRLFQELGSRLPICVKVRNESRVPACKTGLLGTPRIYPVLVVLAIASKGVVNAEPQRAVVWKPASELSASEAGSDGNPAGRVVGHPVIRWLRATRNQLRGASLAAGASALVVVTFVG